MLPALAQLPQPLALIEVGGSEGLCLLRDLYGYDYGGYRVHAKEVQGDGLVFTCSVNKATPLPEIVWRAGLDLKPLDPTDPSQVGWPESLVWLEQTLRLTNLRAAQKIAGAYPPRNAKGDLLGDGLVPLCREAPEDAMLVAFPYSGLGLCRGSG